MAIATYTDLTSAAAAWLDVGTADIASIIPHAVSEAERRIMREVRTLHMETAIGTSIASGVIAVPSDYIEMKHAYVNTNPIQYLQLVSPSFIWERYPTRTADGVPKVMARDGSNFIFGPYPDSTYEINFRYYKHLTPVQTSANPMFVENPDLYLWATLSEIEPTLMRESRLPVWETKYAQVKNFVNGEANRSHFSGNMAIRPA